MKKIKLYFKGALVKVLTPLFKKLEWVPLAEVDKVIKHFGQNIKTLHLEDRTKLFQTWNLISLGKFDKAINHIIISNDGEQIIKASEYLRRMSQYRVAYNLTIKELAEDFRNANVGFTEYIQFLLGRESWVIQFANDLQWTMLTLLKGHVQGKITIKTLELGGGDQKWILPSYNEGVDFNAMFNYIYGGEMEMEIYGHRDNKMTEAYISELEKFCELHNISLDLNVQNESDW